MDRTSGLDFAIQRLDVVLGHRRARQDQRKEGAGRKGSHRQRSRVGKGSQEGVGSEVSKEDRPEDGHAHRPTQLLGGAEQARCAARGLTGRRRQHHIHQRNHQKRQPGAGLIAALDRAQRQVSSQSVLFSDAVAERLELPSSDLEALGFLTDEGPAPAGRLSEITGLTSGAVTRMIDRLERAGYVRREPDPTDRRRVLVRVVPDRVQEVFPLFEPMQQAAHEVYARYTDQELALLLDFLQSAYEVGLRETARLRRGSSALG